MATKTEENVFLTFFKLCLYSFLYWIPLALIGVIAAALTVPIMYGFKKTKKYIEEREDLYDESFYRD